jgi:hypothetical protein
MEKKNAIQLAVIVAGGIILAGAILSWTPVAIKPSPTVVSNPPSVPEQKSLIAQVGDTVSVGDFTYRIEKIIFKKSFNDALQAHHADGIYLGVVVAVTNRANETKVLDNSLFFVLNEVNQKFDASSEGNFLPNNIMMKQIHPGITTKGILVFEVPNKVDKYNLVLTGGTETNLTAQVILNR